MISILKSLIPDFSHLEESVLKTDDSIVGHQCVLVLKSGYPFAGGTSSNQDVARRVCAAEAIERTYVIRAKENGEATTSCGFAAGFQQRPTIFRAICEAVERWAWSKWIDEERATEYVPLSAESPLEKYLFADFSDVAAFEQPLFIDPHLLPSFISQDVMFNVILGQSNKGLFPGSRVTTSQDKRWEHPILEAWRHRMIFLNELNGTNPENIFDQRIEYFARNGESQLAKIHSFSRKPWPSPKLSLLKEVAHRDGYYVWRAFCENYQAWELGNVDRFIF